MNSVHVALYSKINGVSFFFFFFSPENGQTSVLYSDEFLDSSNESGEHLQQDSIEATGNGSKSFPTVAHIVLAY